MTLPPSLGATSTGGHVGAFSVMDAADTGRRESLWHEMQDTLDHLRRYARDRGLESFLVENMASSREPSLRSQIRELLRYPDDELASVALCLDVGHQCVVGTSGDERDPYVWLRQLGERSAIVHLQQSDDAADHHWPFTAERNALGRIHPSAVLEALAESGAEHVQFILEVIPSFEADDRQVLADLRESVVLWRNALAAR